MQQLLKYFWGNFESLPSTVKAVLVNSAFSETCQTEVVYDDHTAEEPLRGPLGTQADNVQGIGHIDMENTIPLFEITSG